MPFIQVWDSQAELSDTRADFEIHLDVNERPHTLVCEVKSNGQPRFVREALFMLIEYDRHRQGIQRPFTKVFIAPFLSAEARQLCRSHGVGYLDFEGNAWLQFASVYIETQAPANSKPERRELRSVFAPKSAQVLHMLLRDPWKHWRLADLARDAHVSIGHVSNVKQALLDREWALVDAEGLTLMQPLRMLEAWRDAYDGQTGERMRFYTTYHGGELERRVAQALSIANDVGDAMLASFSAAKYIAPYGRSYSTHIYADRAALKVLNAELSLQPVTEGDNVSVLIPENRGLFLEKYSPATDVACTRPVQTYLDLWRAGERGQEAAEHLRRQQLKWTT
ncbi:MAG: type IV toxin-antitoxin system AbiEi family antitoxin [Terricaulis sp.]